MKRWHEYPRPAVSVDVAALTVVPGADTAPPWLGLLVRHSPTGADGDGGWDLPGGFLEEGETLSDTVRRVLWETCGLADLADAQGRAPHQLHVFDDPGRDPRGWVVSVAHMIAVPFDRLPWPLAYRQDPRVRLARVVPVEEEFDVGAPPPPRDSREHPDRAPGRSDFTVQPPDYDYDSGAAAGAIAEQRLWEAPSAPPYQSAARGLRRDFPDYPEPSPLRRGTSATSDFSSRRVGELISRDERMSERGQPLALELDGWPLHLPRDHAEMVAMAVRSLRTAYRLNPDPERLLVTGSPTEVLREPTSFTLTELRHVHEAVEGRPIQRDNFSRMFRRRLEPSGSTAGRGTVGRPASTFRHRSDDDQEAN